LVASTAIEIGLPVSALAKPVQLLISVYPVILKAPPFLAQACLTALYGY
jgi:hypothetical protein